MKTKKLVTKNLFLKERTFTEVGETEAGVHLGLQGGPVVLQTLLQGQQVFSQLCRTDDRLPVNLKI